MGQIEATFASKFRSNPLKQKLVIPGQKMSILLIPSYCLKSGFSIGHISCAADHWPLDAKKQLRHKQNTRPLNLLKPVKETGTLCRTNRTTHQLHLRIDK